jgi:hypothetical protein
MGIIPVYSIVAAAATAAQSIVPVAKYQQHVSTVAQYLSSVTSLQSLDSGLSGSSSLLSNQNFRKLSRIESNPESASDLLSALPSLHPAPGHRTTTQQLPLPLRLQTSDFRHLYYSTLLIYHSKYLPEI